MSAELRGKLQSYGFMDIRRSEPFSRSETIVGCFICTVVAIRKFRTGVEIRGIDADSCSQPSSFLEEFRDCWAELILFVLCSLCWWDGKPIFLHFQAYRM